MMQIFLKQRVLKDLIRQGDMRLNPPFSGIGMVGPIGKCRICIEQKGQLLSQ